MKNPVEPSLLPGAGDVRNCYRGDRVAVERIVEWLPFEQLTIESEWPLGSKVRITTALRSGGRGVLVESRFGRPEGKGPLHTAAVRLALGLRRRSLEEECRRAAAVFRERVEAEMGPGRGRPGQRQA